MNKDDFDLDKFAQYEELFDPLKTDRKARRKRKPKVQHTPKKSNGQIIAEIADATSVEGGFNTTYQPARYEAEWLLSSLRSFFLEEWISDVLAIIKGGKEANVYRCQAHPGMDVPLLAVKVYRPRKFRNLRNDKMYREGREILTKEGRPIRAYVEDGGEKIAACSPDAKRQSVGLREQRTLKRPKTAGFLSILARQGFALLARRLQPRAYPQLLHTPVPYRSGTSE